MFFEPSSGHRLRQSGLGCKMAVRRAAGSAHKAKIVVKQSRGLCIGRAKRCSSLLWYKSCFALSHHDQDRVGEPDRGQSLRWSVRRNGKLEVLTSNATELTNWQSMWGVSWPGRCTSFGCCSGTMASF